MTIADSTIKSIQQHGRFQPNSLLGRGSYGAVFDASDRETGKKIALKVIDLDDMDDDISDVMQEITALANCACEQITKYYDSLMLPGTSKLLISMELMACSGSDVLDVAAWPEAGIAYAMRQVLHALAYLHAQRRMHRDVKAANVLLSAAGVVKIADFGVSGQLTQTLGYKRKTFVGTPYWMAPEVIESSEDGYTASADIWSLGITAIEMATQRPPHSDLHPMRVLFVIPKAEQPRLEGRFGAALKDFVATCTNKDPLRRPSAAELLKHPFLKVKEPPAELRALVQQASSRPPSSRGDATGRASVAQSTVRLDRHGSVGAWDFSGDGPENGAATVPRGPPESWSFSGAPDGSQRSSGSGLANTIKGHQISLSDASALDGGTMIIRGTARRAPRPPALAAAARDAQGFVTHTADDMAAPAPSPRNSARPPLQDQGSIRALRSPRGSFRGRPAELQAVPSPSALSFGATPRDGTRSEGKACPALAEVLLPALHAAAAPGRAGSQNGGAPPLAAAHAVAEVAEALGRLEAAEPGACAAFAAEVCAAAVRAPAAGAGELARLRRLAERLGDITNAAPMDRGPDDSGGGALHGFLLQRWRSAAAARALRAARAERS